MDVTLWIVAGILAAVSFMAGMTKAIQPHQKLVRSMAWAEDFTPSTVKLIGVLEMLGAIGLVVPPLLEVAPILAPVAASWLAVTMIAAAVTHARRRGEGRYIMTNLVLMAMAALVAIERFSIEPSRTMTTPVSIVIDCSDPDFLVRSGQRHSATSSKRHQCWFSIAHIRRILLRHEPSYLVSFGLRLPGRIRRCGARGVGPHRAR